jgi:SpoVK/Ycf46/Vps4 family AAA+-type ATPase
MAARRAAGVQARMKQNGNACSITEQLGEVCGLVTQTQAGRFTRQITPRRGPQDLVLPAETHRQVMEIASFYQALSHVNQHWGFGQLTTGAGGLKALFAGDSGTGKNLAAEVIAGQVDLPLLQIDLSQLVSKWVGETEKNIDTAFREAETRHAMLFFDEADTLFGKRGEIQRGSDRYANLEVGYLLQRLDQFAGLVVLASNLEEEIDDAFTRRFQVVLRFPRPAEAERLRLWNMGFPASAPLDPSVNLSSLVHLDLTGAGIFNACHTAGLLAANERSETIRRDHIVEGIARQFHRESRILGPSELKRIGNPHPVSHSIPDGP